MVRPEGRKKANSTKKPSAGACVLCWREDVNNESLGEKRTEDGITIHHHCALFASGLSQMGSDKTEEGLWGFNVKDIAKEMKRSSRLNCTFCKRRYASIGCAVKNCRIALHLPCGHEHGVLNQYFGSFSSFCRQHRPTQAVPCGVLRSPPRRNKLSTPLSATNISTPPSCPSCLGEIEVGDDVLLTPCCRRAHIHRQCLQSQATSSGLHFFRCPLCNDKDKFVSEMLIFGINIPDRDAAWELDANAFQDQLERHCFCDVDECVCQIGRSYNELDSIWEIMLCDWCGKQGTHLRCSNLLTPTDDWICATCTSTAADTTQPNMSMSSQLKTTEEFNETETKLRKRKDSSMDNSSRAGSVSSHRTSITGPSSKHRKIMNQHAEVADVRRLKTSEDKLIDGQMNSDTREPKSSSGVHRKSNGDIRTWFAPAASKSKGCSTVTNNDDMKSETVELLSEELIYKPQPRRLSRYVNVMKLRHSGRSSN